MKNKKETKLAVKEEISPERTREFKDSIKKDFSDPSYIVSEENKIDELAKIIQSENKEDIKQTRKLILEIASIHGLEGGLWIGGIDCEEYRSALVKMKQSITEEYSCRSTSEFMLADRIVSSYWRAMKYEKIFGALIEKEDGTFSLNQLKINALKEIDRGIEMANRQLNNNIILLKEIKEPKLNIKVKADNAYFAQNQQINNRTDGESLKPNDLGKNL